jgi:diphthine-ammonia ligase
MSGDTHPPAAVCFSGGKDSMLALDRALRGGYRAPLLVTLYDGPSERVRFHGVPADVMRAQAEALGLEMLLRPTTPETFERVFLETLADLRRRGVHDMIFGNIHLADVRAWYEERVRAASLTHVEPLWGEEPRALVEEVVVRGYSALLTCVEDARGDPAWLGATLDADLIDRFVARGIDACGERGEYHTLVTAGPLFRHPLAVRTGTTHSTNGFTLLDIALAR